MIFDGPLNNVSAKKELIFEYDTVFPSWMEESITESFYRFPFEYNHHVYDNDKNPFFGKQLYSADYGVDVSMPPSVFPLLKVIEKELIFSIDKTSRYGGLYRVIANGQTPSNSPAPHMDDDRNKDMWTALYYVTDSSGDTVFYNNQSNLKEIHRVSYKKGKVVIFPSSFMHQAIAPDDGWRVSIGIMFKMNCKYNKFIFSESKSNK